MNKTFAIIGKILRIAVVVYKVLTNTKRKKDSNGEPKTPDQAN